MEIKIGVQHVAREIVVDSALEAPEAVELITAALSSGSPLTLTDTKGNVTVVPAGVIGYAAVGAEQKRAVGFTPFAQDG
ncbi:MULTISPECIES: DUF3107 domain-containing protein [Kocuria]|uniref:DUF3107 domain-containing protein n=1 Tax=Kocuria TaxID=57493 RepID=UPI00036A414A|nr:MULTISPECIES: DUF3107 domain-containing protein [Kocuria]EYT51608.1 ATP-binding protein [Kocuria sp. UCD-OTCP]MCM3484134.1 DUF3107 domain-containing protein [Kocuria rosea]PWF81651.1 DUF3107 domain-containing protein [Kocuria rosea]PWF83661.1 DUF3107 domain-containing protein [Kocuria rosea]WIG18450.1 DUF3107 domain-containing protein [Kocuria rosea]